ncbi:hypothetical protein Y032_0752g2053 [Ancylostoma ceylanicum]|uniref:Serpentine receptor class gamma n=2 Tax=Ancylostoma ceylanicum TaxID=53326 RepID=A0A016WEF8_9BILA|nr:hypothetical protein Y032_0752g2053 [Ancylostoma ceylanicum]
MSTQEAYPWTFDAMFLITTVTALYYGYMLIITLYSKSEAFKSAFFMIFRVTGFFDIIGIFAVEWVRTDRKSGFGPAIEPFTRTMYAMTGVCFFTHLFGSFSMTLNRYTAVCFPWVYGKIWTSKNVRILLLVDVIVAFAAHIELFYTRFLYKRVDSGWKGLGRESPIPFVRIVSSCTTIVYGCVSVILISRTIYIAVKVNKKSKGHHKMGLVLFVAFDCLLGLVDCIYESADLFGLSDDNALFIWITNNITLLMFFILSINAYSMTFLSKELRVEAIAPFRRKFCPRQSSDAAITVVISKG